MDWQSVAVELVHRLQPVLYLNVLCSHEDQWSAMVEIQLMHVTSYLDSIKRSILVSIYKTQL